MCKLHCTRDSTAGTGGRRTLFGAVNDGAAGARGFTHEGERRTVTLKATYRDKSARALSSRNSASVFALL